MEGKTGQREGIVGNYPKKSRQQLVTMRGRLEEGYCGAWKDRRKKKKDHPAQLHHARVHLREKPEGGYRGMTELLPGYVWVGDSSVMSVYGASKISRRDLVSVNQRWKNRGGGDKTTKEESERLGA